MDSTDALGYALSLPGAWSDSPWGEDHHLAKVGSKIFLFPAELDGRPAITVKNTAEAVEELKQRYPEDWPGPARYLDKRLWVRVLIDASMTSEVRELIEDSYDLVVAKLPRAQRPGAGLAVTRQAWPVAPVHSSLWMQGLAAGQHLHELIDPAGPGL